MVRYNIDVDEPANLFRLDELKDYKVIKPWELLPTRTRQSWRGRWRRDVEAKQKLKPL